MLSLEEITVSQDLINKLAKLPSLATLVLYSCSWPCEVQHLFLSCTDFRSLNKLKIDVKQLNTLFIMDKALPKLEELDHSNELIIKADKRIMKLTSVVDFAKNVSDAAP
jgi:hypothetical protein